MIVCTLNLVSNLAFDDTLKFALNDTFNLEIFNQYSLFVINILKI